MAFLAVGEVNTGMWSVCFRQEGLWEFDVWFQGLATGPTTVRSLRDRAHTMCRRQRGSKAPLWCIVWNREKLFAIWNNPLKWFLGRRGVFEANGVCWERGARWEDGRRRRRRRRKVAAAERKHMISPQSFTFFRSGDGQRCFEGWSQSSYLVGSIFAPALHLRDALRYG